MRFLKPLVALFLALPTLAAMAAPLSMRLSPDLRGVEPSAVQGRNADLWQGDLRFGDWHVSLPAPFDVRTWTWEVLLPESRRDEEARVDVTRTAFQFAMRPAASSGDAVQAQCMARGRFGVHTEFRGRVSDETTVTVPGYPRLDCRFSGAHPGQLSLRPDFVTQRDSGLARFGERLWNLQSVNNLASQRSSFPLALFGYEFSAGGQVLAAVEIAGRGRVWLHPQLDTRQREELAAAISALLYYSELLESEDS